MKPNEALDKIAKGCNHCEKSLIETNNKWWVEKIGKYEIYEDLFITYPGEARREDGPTVTMIRIPIQDWNAIKKEITHDR